MTLKISFGYDATDIWYCLENFVIGVDLYLGVNLQTGSWVVWLTSDMGAAGEQGGLSWHCIASAQNRYIGRRRSGNRSISTEGKIHDWTPADAGMQGRNTAETILKVINLPAY